MAVLCVTVSEPNWKSSLLPVSYTHLGTRVDKTLQISGLKSYTFETVIKMLNINWILIQTSWEETRRHPFTILLNYRCCCFTYGSKTWTTAGNKQVEYNSKFLCTRVHKTWFHKKPLPQRGTKNNNINENIKRIELN